ncbi:YcxB family protein [Thermoclostridium stercorarium]|uniref:YcxB family protein n=1 Tax=Thermoclostridium stercorarium TaxID=1510 RepID=UPI001FA727EB|nr:YcxB family protein [Thermoclostridium stercorarium]
MFLYAVAVLTVVLKVERVNAKRVKTDKTGTFDNVNTLKFYVDRIVFENDALRSKGELKYNQFYAVLESKDCFILYLTANQATLIRKKDVENLNLFKDFLLKNSRKYIKRYKLRFT